MQQPELEPVITIDPDTRVVTVPKQLYNIAVVGDHNAETVYITVPRFFDGIDLSYDNPDPKATDDHLPFIRFLNAKGEYGEVRPSLEYVDINGIEHIKLGWPIGHPVTDYSGEIQFSVVFKATELHEDLTSDVMYQWQTLVGKMNIQQTLPTEAKEQVYATAKEQFYYEVFKQIAELKFDIRQIDAEAIKALTDRVQTLSLIVSDLDRELNDAAWVKNKSTKSE